MEGESQAPTGPEVPAPVGLSISQASEKLGERWSTEPEGEETVEERQEAAPGPEDEDTQEEVRFEGDEGVEVSEDEHTGEEGQETTSYFEDFDDLVDAVGYGKNEFMTHLRVPVRMDDGSTSTVNMHELVQGYQRGARHQAEMAAIEEGSATLRARQEELQKTYQERAGALEEAMVVAMGTLEFQEKTVKDYYDSIDWNKVRSENEGAYAALQADRDRAIQTIKDNTEGLRQKYQEAVQKQKSDAEKAFAEKRVEERKKLIGRRSEWADPKVCAQAGAEIGQYLMKEYGATSDEVQGLIDHRMLDITYKAMLYDRAVKGSKPKPPGNGKVKLLRPGAAKQGGGRRRLTPVKKAEDAKAKLSRTHAQKDGSKALSARWEERESRRSR